MTLSTATPEPAPLQRRRALAQAFLYTQAALAALALTGVLALLAARFAPPAFAAAWDAVSARSQWPPNGLPLLLLALGGAALFVANDVATGWLSRPYGFGGPSWLWKVSSLFMLAGAAAACICVLVFVVLAFSAPVFAPDAFF